MRGRDRPAGKPRNRAATRNAAHADLPMSEKRVLARGESQIAGEHELASGAAGPPRIDAMVTTGARARRTRTSTQADSPVGPTPSAAVLLVSFSKSSWDQVEIRVNAVEYNDVEVRVLLDDGDEIAELSDGRSRDGVDRRMVERHMAVSGVTAIDPEVRPGAVGSNRKQRRIGFEKAPMISTFEGGNARIE